MASDRTDRRAQEDVQRSVHENARPASHEANAGNAWTVEVAEQSLNQNTAAVDFMIFPDIPAVLDFLHAQDKKAA